MGLIASGVQAVDSLHDPFRPLNTGFNHAVGDRAAVRHSEQVIRPLHVHGAQDRRHEPDHTFAPLIHRQEILRLRLLFVYREAECCRSVGLGDGVRLYPCQEEPQERAELPLCKIRH